MDASDVFRHIEGLGTYQPRFPQGYQPSRPTIAIRDEHVEEDGSHRIAHTLTACCRCRQVCALLPHPKGSCIDYQSLFATFPNQNQRC